MDTKANTSKYATYALAVLLAVNLLNYVDRQILYAVFPLIKADLLLSDTALGLLGSAFMVSYMVSAPVLGWLGDRLSRIKLASGGLAVWSIATAASGFAFSYRALLAARTVVGVGEASFGTVSPGLLADYHPRERRGTILSYFYLAIPVGSALGYVFGGILGQNFGWHSAFLLVGLPGLFLTVPLRLLREPLGHTADRVEPERRAGVPKKYADLFKNRSYLTNTLAMACMTFALGGLAQWMPTFLYRMHGLDVARGNTWFGAITILAGIAGTLAGGWLGDRFQKKSVKGYLLVSAWGFVLGAPVTAFALLTRSLSACFTAIFLAEFFLFLNTGPLNTVIVNVTAPSVRAMSFAVNIFFIHALGDAVSPTILGRLSDLWGLRASLLVTPVLIILAAVFCFVCMKFIGEDTRKVSGQDATLP